MTSISPKKQKEKVQFIGLCDLLKRCIPNSVKDRFSCVPLKNCFACVKGYQFKITKSAKRDAYDFCDKVTELFQTHLPEDKIKVRLNPQEKDYYTINIVGDLDIEKSILDKMNQEIDRLELDDDSLCVLCVTFPKTCVPPCGHLITCETCINRLLQTSRNKIAPCPICRIPFDRFTKIHNS